MLRKFFDRFRPKRHTDAVFGELLFMAVADPAKSYWEGAGVFRATGDEVEYFIDASENGPGPPQHQFFERLNDTWTAVLAEVTPILERSWRETEGTNTPGESGLRLSSLSIPVEDTPDSDWELSFEVPNDVRGRLFSVRMRGWKPTGEIEISD